MPATFASRVDTVVRRRINRCIDQYLESRRAERDSTQPPLITSKMHKTLVEIIENHERKALSAVHGAVADAGRRINVFAPVYRLSEDVLIAIFSHLENIPLMRAALVCQRWRAVALTTPTLWNNIDLSTGEKFTRRSQLMLSRSKTLPLDVIVLMTPCGEADYDDSDMEEMCDAIAEEQVEQLEILLRNKCQQLRSLKVTFVHPCTMMTPTLFLPHSPNLVKLVLNWHASFLSLDFEAHGDFTKVTHLELHNVSHTPCITSNFPNVINLTLSYPHDDDEEGEVAIDIAHILKHTPKVKTLSLMHLTNETMVLLQRSVKLNSLTLHGFGAQQALEFVHAMASSVLTTIPEVIVTSHNCQPLPATSAAGASVFDTFKSPTQAGHDAQLFVRAIGEHRHASAVNSQGVRRLLTTSNIHPGDIPFAAHFTVLTISVMVLRCQDFPTVLPRLETLRIHLYTKTTQVHHAVAAPRLSNVELYFERNNEALIVSDALKIITNCIKDAFMPLMNVSVYGVKCSDGDSKKKTGRVAKHFKHSLTFDPKVAPFPADAMKCA
ncbi:hypothetical protein BKA62DRAFT_504882 [Auriculariales sp. MPI-PUGE-AT-0066]|nr:hypothetical protein BKA62DRAFT_504882 [Auriculariales sp. MPI-PUGE-AT-0066]